MSYTTDNDGGEIYDRDAVTHQEVTKDKRYAKDHTGRSYYPRDEHGNEFVDPSVTEKYIEEDGEYRMPLKVNGDPKYETDQADDEVYPEVKGQKFYGRNRKGHQVYARKKDGDEFYLDDATPARRLDGTPYYAKTKTGQTVFPKKGADEEYVGYVNPRDPDTIPTRYARKNGEEFYPQTITHDGYVSDYIVGDKYAQLANQKFSYPKDAFDNEFYLPDRIKTTGVLRTASQMLISADKRYAVTNDKKVILPGIGNKPVVEGTIAKPTIAEVLGTLVRDKATWSGFLTSEENAAATAGTPIAYSYVDKSLKKIDVTPPGAQEPRKPTITQGPVNIPRTKSAVATPIPIYKTWYFMIAVIASLILKSFALWWFFLRKRSVNVR